MNSRMITYPSIVEKGNTHTVVLIDPTVQDLVRLERFLQTSSKEFDIYLYQGDLFDLEWLNHVGKSADEYLINDISHVKITPSGLRYGQGQKLVDFLEYFEQIEQQLVDNQREKVL